jgi:ankyrin repeat protein
MILQSADAFVKPVVLARMRRFVVEPLVPFARARPRRIAALEFRERLSHRNTHETHRALYLLPEALVALGADLTVKDSNGRTPLDAAERAGLPDVVAFLKRAATAK